MGGLYGDLADMIDRMYDSQKEDIQDIKEEVHKTNEYLEDIKNLLQSIERSVRSK